MTGFDSTWKSNPQTRYGENVTKVCGIEVGQWVRIRL